MRIEAMRRPFDEGLKLLRGGERARALDAQRVVVRGRSGRVVFPDLPHGVYALTVCHDENANEDCDTNFLGLPKEGIAVSNDAMRRFGPPRFEDASFRLDEPQRSLSVRMFYR